MNKTYDKENKHESKKKPTREEKLLVIKTDNRTY